MVTHYQHATEDRDAFLAKAMAPFVIPGGQLATDPEQAPVADPTLATAEDDAQATPARTAQPRLHAVPGDRARSRTDRARRKSQDKDTPKTGRWPGRVGREAPGERLELST
jgi:hypothetical protein